MPEDMNQQIRKRLMNQMGAGNTGIVGPPPPPDPPQAPPGSRPGAENTFLPASARQTLTAQPQQNMASFGGGPAAPASSFNREGFRDAWMGTGTDVGAQNALLGQHGLTADQAGRVRLPTGEMLDLRIGAKEGRNQAGWTTVAGEESKYGQGGGGGGGGYGGGPSGPGGGAGGAGGGFQDQIRQLLMTQLQGLSKPIDENDPAIAGELASQSRGIERDRQARRAAMAERAASQGLLSGGASSGAFDADVASGFEDASQRKSDVRSQLFARELGSRRNQLAQMLSLATQSGDAESARALQLQLGQMDNELRKMGLSEQARQFNDQFGLQAGQFQYQKDRDVAQFGAGGF